MTIYVDPKTDLAAAFSTASGVVVSPSDLIYGTPVVTSSAEQSAKGCNTKIGLGFQSSSTVGTGGDKFFYNRLDVAPLALANLKGNAVAVGANTAAMLPVIKNFTGAVFTVDDLVDHSTVQGDDGSITFLLEAKPTSIGWIGSVTMVLSNATSMSSEFSDDQLAGFQ